MDSLLKKLITQPDSFSASDAGTATRLIMNSSDVTPAQVGAFLVALKLTGKEHLPAFISEVGAAMRDAARQIPNLSANHDQNQKEDDPIVDIVGTGGDGQDTFNVSTAAGIVAAGAGLGVAKHGNRASSSSCGSADVLEALGCNLMNVTPEKVPAILGTSRFCFLFSQAFHPAMKNVAGPRKQIGVRTIFNILGPLTNPAHPSKVVIGVYTESLGQIMAEALHLSGVKRAWVVCGAIGLDEISPTGSTHVWSLEPSGEITRFSISPADFGLKELPDLSSVVGGDSAHNSSIMTRLLADELPVDHPILNYVLMNTAALLTVAGKSASLKEGVELARKSITSGEARRALDGFVKASQS